MNRAILIVGGLAAFLIFVVWPVLIVLVGAALDPLIH